MLRLLLSLALVSLAPGCGTISSYASGCPAAYSGVHYDRDLLVAYLSDLSTDRERRLRNAWDPWGVALDLPISAALDTVTLPLGWALRSHPHPAGHMGCPREDQARPWQSTWRRAAS